MKRRAFLRSLAGGFAVLPPAPRWVLSPRVGRGQHAGQAAAPAIIRAPGSVPVLSQGVAAGDAGSGRIVIWSRAIAPPAWRSTTPRPNGSLTCGRYGAQPPSRAATSRRASCSPTFRPVNASSIAFDSRTSRIFGNGANRRSGASARLRGADARDVTLHGRPTRWVRDGAINPDFGGMRLYETMLKAEPDLFIHCGDTIYADGPLQPEVKLDDGSVWRNVVTPAKSKVAESLDEYRGNYQYNLMDAHMRRFNASVAQAVLWDDHEVRDNWYPTRDLSSDARYTTKSAALLAARARQAFLEYNPLPILGDDPERIYRTVSSGRSSTSSRSICGAIAARTARTGSRELGDDSRIMGAAQVSWLKARLAASRATWKVIANDMPIGLVVRDGPATSKRSPTATMVRRLDASSRSPRSCASSATAGSATSSGSPATSITAPRITTTRRGRVSPTSIRSGSSSPARCTRGRSRRDRSTPRLARR